MILQLTDSFLLAHFVEKTLDVLRHGASTLVKNGELRLVVQYAGETHALFLSTAQNIFPLFTGVPTTFTVGKVAKTGILQNALQIVFGLSLLTHIVMPVRVNDLVAQRTDAEIGSLRQEHDAILTNILWTTDESSVDWPKASKNTGNRRLTDTVGARDLSASVICLFRP